MPRFAPGNPGKAKGTKDKSPRMTAARKQAAVAAASGITPLELMLRTMRLAWEEADRIAADADDNPECAADAMRHRMIAVGVAEKAAPYLHAKLAAVQVDLNANLTSDLSDSDLTRAIDLLRVAVAEPSGEAGS